MPWTRRSIACSRRVVSWSRRVVACTPRDVAYARRDVVLSDCAMACAERAILFPARGGARERVALDAAILVGLRDDTPLYYPPRTGAFVKREGECQSVLRSRSDFHAAGGAHAPPTHRVQEAETTSGQVGELPSPNRLRDHRANPGETGTLLRAAGDWDEEQREGERAHHGDWGAGYGTRAGYGAASPRVPLLLRIHPVHARRTVLGCGAAAVFAPMVTLAACAT